MGIEHVSWALRRVRNVDPADKLILISLANYADEDGLCWPSMTTLAENTGLSEATIKRRRKVLREAGAFAEVGRSTLRGRTQSNTYRLNMAWIGPEIVVPEAASTEADDVAEGVHHEPPEGGHPEPQGVHHDPHGGAHHEPPTSLNHQSRTLTGREEDEARALALEEKFQELVAVFNPGPTESLQRGRALFGVLEEAERTRALQHAKTFLAAMAKEGRRRIAIATYLGERRWEAVARVAAQSVTERSGGRFFVRKGTRAWLAWAKAKGKNPDTMMSIHSTEFGQNGWWFESLFPPGVVENDGGDDDSKVEL